MTAAAKETPAMELKLGSWAKTKWTDAKIMIQNVRLIFGHDSHTKSWNFINEVPPVTMYTMSTPTSTINCWGTTIHNPSFSPNACCPSSW